MKMFITILIITFSLQATAQKVFTVKFHNLKRKPIIEAQVNGKKAYFLIDTGADISILNTDDAKKYGFKNLRMMGPDQVLTGLGSSTEEFWRASKANVKVGGHIIYARFYSVDIQNVIDSLFENTNIRILGILGSDVLMNYSMKIDYQLGQLSMSPRHP